MNSQSVHINYFIFYLNLKLVLFQLKNMLEMKTVKVELGESQPRLSLKIQTYLVTELLHQSIAKNSNKNKNVNWEASLRKFKPFSFSFQIKLSPRFSFCFVVNIVKTCLRKLI